MVDDPGEDASDMRSGTRDTPAEAPNADRGSMTDEMIIVVSDDRRTIRIPDEEWDAAGALADAEGETRSDLVRRLLRQEAMRKPDSIGFRTEFRATLLTPVAGSDAPIVHDRLTGAEDELRKVFPRTTWDLEARDVSPWRPASRRPTASARSEDR